MKITDEMVKVFAEHFIGRPGASIRDALAVALADIPEPVQGPFMLTENEEARVRAYEHQFATVGQNELAAIVRRAQRTLAAPAQAGGEWSAEDYARARKAFAVVADGKDGVASALDAVSYKLAASSIEPLSADLLRDVETITTIPWDYSLATERVCSELLRRCPAPAPVLNPIEALLAKWRARADSSPAAGCFASELEAALAAHEASK